MIFVAPYDEVYIEVFTDENGYLYEMWDYFSFYVPGYKFMPKYKNGMWNGKIYLFDKRTNLLYRGLLSHLENFAEKRNYEIELHEDLKLEESFSVKEAEEFCDSLKLPFKVRDYQLSAFVDCVRNKRRLILSPTASGKSLIIYLLSKYYNKKTLLVVPTVNLVTQMTGDFKEYGNSEEVHMIKAGADKDSDARVFVSTWQSIYKQPKSWFKQFEVIIGDEAHLYKAHSLKAILEKLTDCKYRFGFTGTLDGTETHQLVLEGLFGSVKNVITTKELIDQKHLANFNIKCLVLKYPEELRKQQRKNTWQEEMSFLTSYMPRNIFIRNLTLSLKGNTLVLFQYVEKHGKIIQDLIKKKAGKRKVFFVYGGTKGDEREQVRKIVETEKDSIIIASYGVYSTGVNIKHLHNIVFASPTKSRIRNLQSIGRGLRKGKEKELCTLIDISDDLRHGKTWVNYTLKHFMHRVKIYSEEKFNYKIHNIEVKWKKSNQIKNIN